MSFEIKPWHIWILCSAILSALAFLVGKWYISTQNSKFIYLVIIIQMSAIYCFLKSIPKQSNSIFSDNNFTILKVMLIFIGVIVSRFFF